MTQKQTLPNTVVIERLDQLQTILALLREDFSRTDNHTEEEISAAKKKSISYSSYTMTYRSEWRT